MEKVPSMVDLKRTPKEVQESIPTPGDQSQYPYGLCISLCADELEKLGFTRDDLQVNDMVHFHAMATVTSTSSRDSMTSEPDTRVELQITHMSAEDEDEEDEEAEKQMETKNRPSKLYKS